MRPKRRKIKNKKRNGQNGIQVIGIMGMRIWEVKKVIKNFINHHTFNQETSIITFWRMKRKEWKLQCHAEILDTLFLWEAMARILRGEFIMKLTKFITKETLACFTCTYNHSRKVIEVKTMILCKV